MSLSNIASLHSTHRFYQTVPSLTDSENLPADLGTLPGQSFVGVATGQAFLLFKYQLFLVTFFFKLSIFHSFIKILLFVKITPDRG